MDCPKRFKLDILCPVAGLFVIVFLMLGLSAQAAMQADVIVYGATPGGFCAAVAAAREGVSVILLEPTGHVGGVNTGGLSFSDSNQTVRSTLRGLFEEWHSRIEKDYRDRGVKLPYQVIVKDQAYWTYEPHVAARVTNAMLAEAGVKVMTRRVLKLVEKDGSRIMRIRTSDGDFSAATFIDGTYEGDLMAAAGVAWTIGREGRGEFGESLAGKQYPKPSMAISGLGSSGAPLPLITAMDAGPEADGDSNVMVYSFRLCVTKNPENRVPFPRPANYDGSRFEVVRRYFAQQKRPQVPWDFYPLPGHKFDANNGIGKQFSMGLVGGGNSWSDADEAERAKIWESHKQYTLEMYHFLSNDPAVPAEIREEYAQIGLCRDEFAEYGHWSPQLYVREGRRMIGEYVLSQKDIREDPRKEDAIVVSSFPIDSHDCQRVGTGSMVVNEGTIMPVRMPGRGHGYPYHVPYRAITPRAAECQNLLVPVALSCTHVGISSIRVEPTWMSLGQSAGIAAAMSAKQKIAVQELPYSDLRARLVAQKQVLDLPVLPDLPTEQRSVTSVVPSSLPGLVLDDSHADIRGGWSRSSVFKPHVGGGYQHDDRRADGESIAVFRFRAPSRGKYDLRMAYSAHETRATNVPVTIESSGLSTVFKVDQRVRMDAGELFRSIGHVELEGDCVITIRNSGTDGFVILDALQLLPLPK
jgi:hypothetical protein